MHTIKFSTKPSTTSWRSGDIYVTVTTPDDPRYTYAAPATCLFSRRDHLLTQSCSDIFSFSLSRNSRRLAEIHCHRKDSDVWISPPKAPFGGIILQNHCTNGELRFFVRCLLGFLRMHNCRTLVVKAAPSCYNYTHDRQLQHIYTSAGFVRTAEILNQHIPVNSKSFLQRIHAQESRQLRKSWRSGLETLIAGIHDGHDVYRFISDIYLLKGYNIPVSEEEFTVLLEKFPAHFLLFVAKKDRQLTAATVFVRVSDSVLYLFMSAFDTSYRSLSPVVLLMEKAYEYSQKHGCKILDLGTSLDSAGLQKPSLSRFKKNLGAENSVKRVYEYQFDKTDRISSFRIKTV